MDKMKYVGDKKTLWAYPLICSSLVYGSLILTLFSPHSAKAQIAVQGEYIVKLKVSDVPAGGPSGKAGVQRKTMQFASKMSKSFQTLSTHPEMGMLSIRAKSLEDVQFLKNHPEVEFVEPNYILSNEPTMLSDSSQNSGDTSAFNNPVGAYGQTFADIGMKQAWQSMTPPDRSGKVIVAVIDSGIDINHRIFQETKALWLNSGEYGLDAYGRNKATNGIDDDGNGLIDDVHGFDFLIGHGRNLKDENGHGTHVAGIVVGAGVNVLGADLDESPIEIMSLRFLDRNGKGNTSNAIKAIQYAIAKGARVINNSWGGPSYSRALHEAYIHAYENNVVIVTAAGNEAKDLDYEPTYPASLDVPNNITVSATDDFDNRTTFSNFSSRLSHVASPGLRVWSSYPTIYCQDQSSNPNQYVFPSNYYGGCFASMSGTSMATPLVAGLTALAIRENSGLSAYNMTNEVVKKSVDSVSVLQGYVSTKGRINASEVIRNAVNSFGLSGVENPPYSPVFKSDRGVASSTEAPMGGCGTVKTISSSTGFGQFSLSEALVLLLLLTPFVVLQVLRYRSQQDSNKSVIQRRKFTRYDFSETIKVKVKDQEFDLQSTTLSLGGLSFKGQVKIEKGEKIKIMLGALNSEIEGEVVWSAQDKQYGVKFSGVSEGVIAQLKQITQGLALSS